MRTLVVEDDPITASDLTEIVRQLGYGEVLRTDSLPGALTAVDDEAIDLAFVDIYLDAREDPLASAGVPKRADGVDVAKRLAASGAAVVFVSAFADAATLDLAREGGAFGFVVKPFDYDAIFAAAETALATAAMNAAGDHLMGVRAARTMSCLRRYVDQNLGAALSLEQLARVCGVSRASLIRITREQCGRTPHEFVIERKLSEAARKLTADDVAIVEVARLCGFTNHSHFSRLFREHFGRTPGQHRYYSRRAPSGTPA